MNRAARRRFEISKNTRLQHANRAAFGIDFNIDTQWYGELFVHMADHAATEGRYSQWFDVFSQNLLERKRSEARSRATLRTLPEDETANFSQNTVQGQLSQHSVDSIDGFVYIFEKQDAALEIR